MKNILFFFIFLLPVVVFSQPDLKFVRYTTEQGLSNDDILCICQDNYGFMWFGTKDGVSRFDGMEFKAFQHNKKIPGTIAPGWVNGITCDKNNNIWVAIAGAGSSLMKYDYEKDVFIDMDSLLRKELNLFEGTLNSWTIFCDSEGLIWVQIKSSGRYILQINPDNNKIKKIAMPGRENPLYAKCFFEDNDKNIWLLGTDVVLYNKTNNSFKSLKYGPENTSIFGFGECVLQDADKQLWIGANGLIRMVLSKEGYSPLEIFKHDPDNPFSLSANNIYGVAEYDNNNILIGTINGLCLLDKETKKIYRYYNDEIDPESINSNLIRVLYRDKQNTIWAGTSSGVAKLQNKNFRSFSQSLYRNSISHNKIQCVCEAPGSEVWIGTPKGIDIFDRKAGTFRLFAGITRDRNGLYGAPLVMNKDVKKESMWIGTWRGGFSRFDFAKGVFEHYQEKESTSHLSHVFAVFPDSKGNLWISDSNNDNIGVFVYNIEDETYRTFNNDPNDETTISSNQILYISEDTGGQIWIGTSRGISLLPDMSKGDFIRSLESIPVHCIIESSNKKIWAGTDQGLILLSKENQQLAKFDAEDGLPGNQVMGVLEDQNKDLWMSTNKGLARFSRSGDSDPEVTVFRKDEGLRVGDFLPASCSKLSDGAMIFGGSKGFCLFHPDKIKKDTLAPSIVLTNLKIANQTVKVGDTINNQVILPQSIETLEQLVLNHNNNELAIDFAGIHYNMPQYNKYAYRLDGYDNERDKWHLKDAGDREVEYMNLPAGDYVFKVKAANNYGIWNDEPATLKITILPPWWETWWFRISVFLLLATGITSLYFYRINALKRQKQILEKKVAERTSELREANSQLEEKQEEIMQQNEEIITVNNQLKTKNEEIESQKEEIVASRDQLEKAFNNIKVISEFGQKLTATFDFDTINKMIFNYVSSLMDTAAFGIGIYNNKRKIIDFPYFMEKGEPIPYFYKDLESKKSLSVRCFKNTEEIFINNLAQEYKKYLGELPEVQTSELPASIIHLPLIVEGRAIGTITVNSFKKNAYNQNDLANLRTLASYISIALDNSKAYRIIRSKNEQISGSIRYGQTIQQAMLPPKKQLDNYFENFVIFRPKDIVSGDFYWFASINNPLNHQGLVSDNNGNVETRHVEDPGQVGALSLLAVVDCTGHGVPGAFMSMIGSRLLNDIVIERKIYSPAKILEELNNMVRKALRQDVTDNHDGMDLCLCKFQQTGQEWELTYAGAKRSLIFYNSDTNSIEELPGTRKSIGGITARNKIIEFTEIKHNVGKQDIFYLSTDGLIDQCNAKKRKFSQKRLLEIIREIHQLPTDEQKELLEKELDDFQGGFEQRDDITLMGIRLNS